ncbi:hypothetical protein EV359DRAFT_68933 [Lentinula novae-zelandiae]|nr:hypothetical protein EV359DRAFT_68933 [Lentinula novae-zelandiae]
MLPTSHLLLVPRTLTAHPYRTENQRLLAWVRSLESQLAASPRENSSLTTALWDTSHALDARQREVEQLRTSNQEVLQHEIEYCGVLDQFSALDRALSGLPGQTVFQRFQALEEELHVAKKDRDVTVGELSTASRKSSELMTALMQQQGLVNETNALAMCQRHCLEKLWEEVHRTRDRAAFIEQMIKEYPDEDYMQTARGIHRDFYMQSVSSIQWFLNNMVDEDEGLHRLVLENSRFDNDGPFLTVAQHASFATAPEGSLEPPLHRQMLALSTVFPHCDGAGRWDDVVPAIPSLDQSTIVWEQLMLEYLHHITDTPMSVPVPSDEPTPLWESPTSPSPPPPSPSLPPLFGSVANLAIDLTGDDDNLYKPEDSHHARGSEADGMEVAPLSDVLKEEPL